MTRSRKLGGLVVITLVVGMIVVWTQRRTARPIDPARQASAAPRAVIPLALGTHTRGEIATADPAGHLRLEGQVVDASDQPVAGARVTLDALPAQVTTTERDGSFAFDGLIGRRYTVVAAGVDGVAGPATLWLDERTPALILKLRPAAGVDVTVVDAETGAPIAGATVEVRAAMVATATTGDHGTAAVSPVVPGHWAIVVKAARYATAFDSVSASATTRYRLAIALKRGVHARGLVVDSADRPVANAMVWLESVGDWMTELDPERDGVRSAADGSFELTSIARAAYVLHAVAPDRASATTGVLQLDGDTDGLVVRVVAGPQLAGRIVRKDRTPVAGAAVRAAGTRVNRLVHADRDGAFVVDGLPRGPVWLTAGDGTASSKPRRFELERTIDQLEIVLDHDVAISGLVVDHLGAPVEGAQVTGIRSDALEAEANAAIHVQALSDSSGTFTLGGLVAGQYQVSATRDPRRAGAGRPVTVAGGATDVRLTLVSSGGVQGKVAFKAGGKPAAYSVRVGRGGLATQFTTEDFAIEAPPGVQALWIEGPGFTAASVDGITVEEDAVADAGTIELDRGRTLRGRVVARDGTALVGGEVIAGALLSGTGQRVDTGDSGPVFRSDVKHADVAADGSFQITGVATTSVSVVATVASGARSAPVLVPAGTADVAALELAIAREARLSGAVVRGGAPTSALVNAQAQASPLTMFTVQAPRGAYQFDQLAPGRYTVAAITGAPLDGSPFYPRTVELTPGTPATLDLDVTPGPSSLVVETPGAQTGLVFVSTRGGSATSGLALLGELGRQDGGQWAMVPVRGDRATFHELAAGPARVCLVRIPMKAQMTPSALIEQIARAGAGLAATCVTVQLGTTPTTTIAARL